MSVDKSKITDTQHWVDLTDMLIWSGHFTGIQRVVYEYAKRFADKDARFFAYDKIDDRFIEVDTSILDINTREKTLMEQIQSQPKMTVRRRIRKVIQKTYGSLSKKQRKALQPTAEYANYLARTIMHHLIPKKNSRISPYRELADASIKKGDMVILLGAGWNERAFFEKICQLKQQKGLKIVQHINDILPIYQPQLFSDKLVESFAPYMEQVMSCADIVSVISEATKRDVEVFCAEHNIEAPSIHVIRLGDDVRFTKASRPNILTPGDQFILSVGTFEIRKNYILLYQAAKLAQLQGIKLPKIVIAGKRGWLTEDLEHVIQKDPYAKENLIWINDASDSQLEWLYDNCLFTVFPSIAEGWGLPVVESLRHGKLCLASGVTSMLEIGDGLVDYFLPYDANGCLDKMLLHLTNKKYISENKVIHDQYKTYSWDESFLALKDAIEGNNQGCTDRT